MYWMICVCIRETNLEDCSRALENESLAELRLDLMGLPLEETRQLFSLPLKLIATCRPGPYPQGERLQMLKEAVEAGASYVDIEVEAAGDFKRQIVACCRERGCKLIVSYHNYKFTPPFAELRHIVDTCFDSGADIAKIACTVKTGAECARLLALYDDPRDLIALAMGEAGKISRIAAPLLGAPFTYAALCGGRQTADGQIDRDTLRRILTDIAHA
jgi:3-dehydroquinate dehydratase-1